MIVDAAVAMGLSVDAAQEREPTLGGGAGAREVKSNRTENVPTCCSMK